MDYTVGQQVGDYEILDILGAGGMGRVYKIRNVISQRVEAMKVLLADLEGNPELFDRFLREIRVLAALDHPNIAGLRTAQRVGNEVLMIMEYVEGQSLDKLMQRGRIALPHAVRFIQETLHALQYSHSLGVVHRDIKPANIMVDKQGKSRLTDFGIALAAADRRLTQTGRTLGSLFYMSPEQINGDPSIDGRSDLYSLGVTLYEMATGKRPFQGESDFSIMSAHLNTPPTAPIELDPDIPPMLSQVILTALAKDPGQRFQTADAMRMALTHVFSGVSAADDTAPRSIHDGPTAPAMPSSAPPPASVPTLASTAPPPGAAAAQARPQQPGAPQPPQARPQPPQGPTYQPPSQNIKKGSGARLVWLLVGSLVTVAVLVIAAIQLPFFHKTEAGQGDKSTAAQQTAPPKTQPAAQQAIPPVVEEVGKQEAKNRPAQIVPPITPPKSGGLNPPARPVPNTTAAIPPLTGAKSLAGGQERPQQKNDNSNPPVNPPVRRYADSAAVQAQRERMLEIANRTGPIRRSLNNLRQTQARSGLGMRRDFESAEQRLVYMLDEAEAALKAGNAEAAEKNLDAAELSLRFLENNLGR